MTIHYVQYGDIKEGPLLVFLHGGGAGTWMWDKQVDFFSDYHCVVPTLQGHGVRSEESSFSIRRNAEEIVELIQSLQTGRDVHAIGFSIGAQITLEMLSLAPQLLSSAVVNSALLRPMAWATPWIAPTIRMMMPLVRNRNFARLQAKQLYMDGAYFELYYADSVKMKAATLIDMLRENMSYTVPESLSHSKTPVLVTVGEKEKKAVIQSAMELSAFHPNCQSIIVPGIGHGFPIARPELFNETLQNWLSKHSNKGLLACGKGIPT